MEKKEDILKANFKGPFEWNFRQIICLTPTTSGGTSRVGEGRARDWGCCEAVRSPIDETLAPNHVESLTYSVSCLVRSSLRRERPIKAVEAIRGC